MSPLNIHPEENVDTSKKKKNKMLKVMLGISALVLVPVIGSTLAANININGGGANVVQFAQGDIATDGCDKSITISATSKYLSGAYHIDTVTLSDFDFEACNGKTILVSAAEPAGGEVGLTSPGAVAKILVSYANSAGNVSCADQSFTCPVENSLGASSFTFSVDSGPIASVSIDHFLIQTS
jgi:hypothetical protein